MRFAVLAGLAAVLYGSNAVAATCSSSLLIDNFSQWSSNTNSLSDYTSDDGTMTSISASGGVLSFKPASSSYFYETFPCEAATTNGYNSIQFAIKGPSGGSLTIELQTQSSCSATSYTSYYYTLSGLTGSTQTVTIPLSSFTGANLNAITSIVWEAFSSTSTTWQLSNINFGCSAGKSTSSTKTSSSAATSSSSTKVSSTSTSSTSKVSTVSSPTTSSSTQTKTSTSSKSTGSSSSSSSSSSGSSTASSSSATSSSSTVSSTSSTQTSTSSSRSSSTLSTVTTSSASPSGTCASGSTLLIDDFASESRLTFLFYNAMLEASSDDGSMKSVVVGTPKANRVTLTPSSTSSYFYSEFGCFNATAQGYGGISLLITAPAGTSFTVELGYGCGTNAPTGTQDLTTTQLGWTFDGTEKLYTIPFSKYTTVDFTQLYDVLLTGLSKAIVLGPMAFYCGNSGAQYTVTPTPPVTEPSATVAAPAGTAPTLVIDTFPNADSNNLGFWHGYDTGMTVKWGTNKVTLSSNDSDFSFYTQVVGGGCTDWTNYKSGYLHIAYTGNINFTVSLQQHNAACNDSAQPTPYTWDSLEAARYASATDIYMPISHFNIDYTKTIGFSIHGFFSLATVTLTKIEIVDTVPSGFPIPEKLPSGTFRFACTRPNSFAFAIDDGDPIYAQQVIETVKKYNISVTFFTLGLPLQDPSTNLSNVYHEMQSLGHQIAYHSYTHPKMEGLPDYASIDWEYENDINVVKTLFNGFTTTYFRPPFGTEGARMRQRLANAMGTDNPQIIEWSVDVEDWLWAETSTPENQLTAFQGFVNQGGNLVVMHYLYATTVSYLPQFIEMALATGKQLMRVDQCMEDPNAPPL